MTDAGAAARLAGCSGNGGNGNGNGNDGGQRIEDPIQLLPVHAFTDYNKRTDRRSETMSWSRG